MFRVAVCVCTCDRAGPLARLLAAVGKVELGEPAAAEVVLIVVDNRPGRGARGVCEAATPDLPFPLRFIEEPRAGISFARNRAVYAALEWGAEFVAFLDDDDVPRPDWLRRLVDRQRATGADIVFGLWCLPADLALPAWLSDTRYFRPPRRDDRNRYGIPGWAGTYNVLISRRAILSLTEGEGPFRSQFAHCGGEDSDLFIRARAAGFVLAEAPDSVVARVWEPDRLTLRGLLRRGFLRGGSRVHIARAHLPDDQVRSLARSSWRKLGKTLLRLPLGWSRSRIVATLLSLAQALGEVSAWAGLRDDYYLRRRT